MIYLLASILSSVLIPVIIRINESGNLDRLCIGIISIYLFRTCLSSLEKMRRFFQYKKAGKPPFASQPLSRLNSLNNKFFYAALVRIPVTIHFLAASRASGETMAIKA